MVDREETEFKKLKWEIRDLVAGTWTSWLQLLGLIGSPIILLKMLWMGAITTSTLAENYNVKLEQRAQVAEKERDTAFAVSRFRITARPAKAASEE